MTYIGTMFIQTPPHSMSVASEHYGPFPSAEHAESFGEQLLRKVALHSPEASNTYIWRSMPDNTEPQSSTDH